MISCVPKKGYAQSPEHRRRIGEARRGKTHTPETKSLMSAAWDGERRRARSEEMTGNDLAKHFTDDSRARMAEAAANRQRRSNKSGTLLERQVAAALSRSGFRFAAQEKIPGDSRHVWDFVVEDLKVLVEADGCYWHGCVDCGHEGKPTNRKSDAAKNASAKELGWKLIRVKECQFKESSQLSL